MGQFWSRPPATHAAIKELAASRLMLERRIDVVEKNRLDKQRVLRELLERRRVRTPPRLTPAETIRARALATRCRRIIEPSLSRLHGLVTNVEALEEQLKDSFALLEAARALESATHKRPQLTQARVDKLMDDLAERQSELESVSFTALGADLDDDEFEREMEALEAEQTSTGAVSLEDVARVHADERARDEGLRNAALLALTPAPSDEIVDMRAPLLTKPM